MCVCVCVCVSATYPLTVDCVFEDSSGFFARCGDSPIFLTKLSTRGLNCLRSPSTLHANVLVPVIVSQCLSLPPSLSLSLCVCLCVVHTHARACTHAHRLVWCRWKSSHAIMENCSFRGNGYPIIEMQVLPSFFESPPHIRNVTVRSNSFGVGDADTSFQHNNKIPPNKHGAWQKDVTWKNIMDLGPPCCEVEGLTQDGNTIFCACL